MKIVIDIDKHLYTSIIENAYGMFDGRIYEAVRNGTPLPKGHGRLIDELRPTGEWIDEGQYAEGHSEHAYICKKCGYQIIVTPNMIFEERFCKCCGARMKEGNE